MTFDDHHDESADDDLADDDLADDRCDQDDRYDSAAVELTSRGLLREFRRNRRPRMSVSEAIAAFETELWTEVRQEENPGLLLARRTGLEVTRTHRSVKFRATYRSEVADKLVTFDLGFAPGRLVRHARQRFVDIHGFALDELFAIDEVLAHTVDWWHEGEETHSWPPPRRQYGDPSHPPPKAT